MYQSEVPQFKGIGVSIRKRRSQPSRRPIPIEQLLPDQSLVSSTWLSDEMSKVSSDYNNDEANSKGKMFNLNQCVSRSLQVDGSKCGLNELHSNGVTGGGTGNKNRLKKVKLKVGGVTHTIQSKSTFNGASGSCSPGKSNHSSDTSQLWQKENSDEHHSPAVDKKSDLQGIPWKDFSRGRSSIRKEDMGRIPTKNASEKRREKSDQVRKSRRVPKRRVLDAELDEDDDDDEIRYLEKIWTSKIAGIKELDAESAKKQQKGGKYVIVEEVGRSGRDVKKSRSGDGDYVEEELMSDREPEGKKAQKQKKDLSDLPTENKREMTLTTRQRALLSKDASASGGSQIEFPNGLPPLPSRNQKEKLSETEQQLKKAESAQRRKIQNEKAAQELEAEAIRKILGQDSCRKKREDKMKKRQEELAQEKATSAQMLASNTIRWVMGRTGTTVTFPQDIGLPPMFDSKPSSYPPPRESCAGPSCTNPYKYRDSTSRLPLCSLQCYKAIHEKLKAEKAC